MKKNVSDQLVETLVNAGIQRIYAVTGDSLNHVNAAVHCNGKIKWIHVRHEETAAYAAGAEAQPNGLACCAGSSGPGHDHLINGLYDVHHSSASVLAIASTIPSKEFGTSSFQETNYDLVAIPKHMKASPGINIFSKDLSKQLVESLDIPVILY